MSARLMSAKDSVTSECALRAMASPSCIAAISSSGRFNCSRAADSAALPLTMPNVLFASVACANVARLSARASVRLLEVHVQDREPVERVRPPIGIPRRVGERVRLLQVGQRFIGPAQHARGDADRQRRPETDVVVARRRRQVAALVRQRIGLRFVARPRLETAADQQRDRDLRIIARPPSLAVQTVRQLQRGVVAPGLHQGLTVQGVDEAARAGIGRPRPVAPAPRARSTSAVESPAA